MYFVFILHAGDPVNSDGEYRAIFEISRRVEEISGSRGMRIYAGLVIFYFRIQWDGLCRTVTFSRRVQNPKDTCMQDTFARATHSVSCIQQGHYVFNFGHFEAFSALINHNYSPVLQESYF